MGHDIDPHRFAMFQAQVDAQQGKKSPLGDIKVHRLVDMASENQSVRTGFFRSIGTAIVMKGRLEKMGCRSVEIESFEGEAAQGIKPHEYESVPFDANKWFELWSVVEVDSSKAPE